MRLKELHERISREKTAVFTFGRMNPPTVGHEKLLNKLKEVANKNSADWFVYLSSTHDSKKNPLSFERKIYYVKKMFGKEVNEHTFPQETTALHAAAAIHDKGYKKIIMVVGSDRVSNFDTLLNQYNGQDKAHGFYKFDSIKVVSAGERDPDAEGVSGMSASKLRNFAVKGQFAQFQQGILGLSEKDAKSLFNEIRKGLKLQAIREKLKIKSEVASEKVTISELKFSDTFKTEKIPVNIESVLRRKSEVSGIAYSILKSIYEKSIKKFKLGHEIGQIKEQYAIQQINQHLLANNATNDINEDFKLWMEMDESTDVVVSTPTGRYTTKTSSVAQTKNKEKQKFRSAQDRGSVTVRRATGREQRYLDREQDIRSEDAPPGREHQVKSLKKKVGEKKAYAFAWAQHNKHGLPDKKENVEWVKELSSKTLKRISLEESSFDHQVVLQQLGGRKFMAMTGAKNLTFNKEESSLSMKIGKNSAGVNHLKITLEPDDTYTLYFGRIRNLNYKVIRTVKGVYAEALQNVFTEVTGMYTSL